MFFSSTSNQPVEVVQFSEPLPKVQFDDTYGPECYAVIVPSTNQLQCVVPTLAEGLHDIIITYHGVTKVLPQSYMYKSIPNPPTNVGAAGRNESVHLTWDWQDEKPYIATANFYIDCKPSSSSTWRDPATISCDSGNQGAYSAERNSGKMADIVGLQNGVSYDFRIRSYANSVYSDYVYKNDINPIASAYVPTPPIITKAPLSGTTIVSLAWSSPISDGGSPITNYALQIQYYNLTGFSQYVYWIGGSVNSRIIINGGGYSSLGPTSISIIALNANGASAPSEPVLIQLDQPPGPPNNIKVNNVNTDKTMLSWNSPSDNGSPITQYQMRYSTQSNFSDWVDSTTNTCISNSPSPPTTSCVTPSLTLGTKYYYQVRAVNANGEGEWSIIHASIVGAPDRPIITNVTSNTVDSSTSDITVTWNPPNDNGAPITGYTLEWSTDPDFGSGSTTSVSLGNVTTYTLPGAANGQIYWFRVLATNSRGDSPWSDPVSSIPYAPPTLVSINPDHGLTLGNELIVIVGTNLNGATDVTIDGISCLSFSVIDAQTIICLTPPNSTEGAKDVTVINAGGSDTLTEAYTYAEPELSLAIDKTAISINVDIMDMFGNTVTDNQNLTVKTNDPRGYKLTMSMIGSETALLHASLPGEQISPTPASVNAATLPDNSWGYTLANPSADQWVSVPPLAYPRTIKSNTSQTIGGMSGLGDVTKVTFGTKINTHQVAGTYQGTVVYTVVGNL
jgi:hypothetical protein